MHELSLASEIIEIALAEAEKCNAVRVKEIELEVGVLSGVDKDALEFALSLAMKNTILENATVKVSKPGGLGRCNTCNLTFNMMEVYSLCPKCNLPAGHIVGGAELKIISIVVVDD